MSENDLRDEIAALRRKVKAQESEIDELRGRLWHLEHPGEDAPDVPNDQEAA